MTKQDRRLRRERDARVRADALIDAALRNLRYPPTPTRFEPGLDTEASRMVESNYEPPSGGSHTTTRSTP